PRLYIVSDTKKFYGWFPYENYLISNANYNTTILHAHSKYPDHFLSFFFPWLLSFFFPPSPLSFLSSFFSGTTFPFTNSAFVTFPLNVCSPAPCQSSSRYPPTYD